MMPQDFHAVSGPASIVTQKGCNGAGQRRSRILRFSDGEAVRWSCISEKQSETKTLETREKEV